MYWPDSMSFIKYAILTGYESRGTEGEFMSAQVPMGKATPNVLDALNIPYFKPDTPEKALEDIKEAWNIATEKGTAVGILLEISFW